MEDRYFDLKKLSDYSSMSVRTLREYVTRSDNPIPSFRLGKKIIIKRSEFDGWIEAYRNSTGGFDKIVEDVMRDLRFNR
ncbi:MAG: DNA-binding protein [Desulfobacteraceae bacterium]|nr:MAG: DNA-binding protein [Desulfobacteraceae bacterium]